MARNHERILVVAMLVVAVAGCAGEPAATMPKSASVGTLAPASPTGGAPIASPISRQLPRGRLAFERDVGNVPSLFTMNVDGTDMNPLPAGGSPRWAPDGRHLSIVANSPQGVVFFGLVEPDGSNYVKFDSPDPTLELGCVPWSADGLRLACEGFDGTDVTRNGIYTVRTSDGGDLVRVTSSPNGAHDMPTDYSPDGSEIVFTRQMLPDESDLTLMVVNADGTDARALSDQRIGGGRWSPDGKTILTDTNGSIVLVPVDASQSRTLTIDAGGMLNPTGPTWSPDGEWIAFSGHTDAGFDLFVVRADGTDLHPVTKTANIWEGDVDWAAVAP